MSTEACIEKTLTAKYWLPFSFLINIPDAVSSANAIGQQVYALPLVRMPKPNARMAPKAQLAEYLDTQVVAMVHLEGRFIFSWNHLVNVHIEEVITVRNGDAEDLFAVGRSNGNLTVGTFRNDTNTLAFVPSESDDSRHVPYMPSLRRRSPANPA
ncbi:uncharacterized protein ARMOST_01713 [Armillaria ostoyae]|uniref:Uncharacterized protein n=1 Tax=Armillaria ostoyae TaxID=47428 RepID=A0A284QPP9_ARMOS|nr:uncharacterized protein ARMOST_01713 [Armillaria ostoyae]